MTRPLAPGELVVPGYEVIAHLKRTLALDVYDVWSEERRARCIVKTVRPEQSANAHARRALAREGRLLLSLTHPHIVRCYEYLPRPRAALVLETLQGATLGRALDDLPRRRLPAEDLGWLGIHLCSALAYMHSRRLLHLDLKPSNVISDRGQAKLIDLSIARAPGGGKPGVGTREYMAPEQRTGERVGFSTDVYGLGGVMYEAATGRRPRACASPRKLRRLPAVVADAIEGALQVTPRERPALEELERAFEVLVG